MCIRDRLQHHAANDGLLHKTGGDAAFRTDAVDGQDRQIRVVTPELIFHIRTGGEAILGVDLATQQDNVGGGQGAQFQCDRHGVGDDVQISADFQCACDQLRGRTGVDKERASVPHDARNGGGDEMCIRDRLFARQPCDASCGGERRREPGVPGRENASRRGGA